MAATSDQVRAITGSILPDPELDFALTAAACVMAFVVPCTTGKNITAECLDQAEAWLASHFLSISNVGKKIRVVESEKFESYSTKWAMSKMEGEGVLSSTYGDAANTMVKGCLAGIGKESASICFFG